MSAQRFLLAVVLTPLILLGLPVYALLSVASLAWDTAGTLNEPRT